MAKQVPGAELTYLLVAHLHQPEPDDLVTQQLVRERRVVVVEADDDGDGLQGAWPLGEGSAGALVELVPGVIL